MKSQNELKHNVFMSSGTIFHNSLLLLGLLTLFSCSKKTNDSESLGGTASVTISVTGLNQAESGNPRLKSMSTLPQALHDENITQQRLLSSGHYNMSLTAVETADMDFGGHTENSSYRSFNLVKQASAGKSIGSSALNPLAANVAMGEGVKYMFILYNTSTQHFEHIVQGTSGTSLTLDIVKGQEYKWYAYSYNDTDNLPQLASSTPVVQTYTDKPLLYAANTFKWSSTGNGDLKITFTHQLKQIHVQLDSRGAYGDILTHAAHFVEDDYIKTGKFNILDGSFSNLVTIPVTDLNFVDPIEGSNQVKFVQFYSADVSRNTYKVNVTDLTISQPDGSTIDLVQDFPEGREETFAFSPDARGKIHSAEIDVWRSISKKWILQPETDRNYCYVASRSDRASGAFFRDKRNFGPDISSHMRVESMSYDVYNPPLNGIIQEKLDSYPINGGPKVMIMASAPSISTSDYEAIIRYLHRGGALLVLASRDYNHRVQDILFKGIFPNSPNLTLDTRYGAGSVFKLKNVDPNIMTWPFGDVRESYWGAHDSTLFVNGLSQSDLDNIVVYSNGAVNRKDHYLNSISMFRHKTLNFFYIADEGFLANNLPDVTSIGFDNGINPFVVDQNNYPIARRSFGRAPENGAIESGASSASWSVRNPVLFGNIISWLLLRAQFQGVPE